MCANTAQQTNKLKAVRVGGMQWNASLATSLEVIWPVPRPLETRFSLKCSFLHPDRTDGDTQNYASVVDHLHPRCVYGEESSLEILDCSETGLHLFYSFLYGSNQICSLMVDQWQRLSKSAANALRNQPWQIPCMHWGTLGRDENVPGTHFQTGHMAWL